jgi:hypothetical protein
MRGQRNTIIREYINNKDLLVPKRVAVGRRYEVCFVICFIVFCLFLKILSLKMCFAVCLMSVVVFTRVRPYANSSDLASPHHVLSFLFQLL